METNGCPHILVLCVGNICRSPMAECVLRTRLGAGFTIESAGLRALAGRTIDPTAEAVLGEHDLSARNHVARQITSEMVARAGLILVMEEPHLAAVQALVPEAADKSFLLGHWNEKVQIPDPYRQPRYVFRNVYWMIDKVTAAWSQRLVQSVPG